MPTTPRSPAPSHRSKPKRRWDARRRVVIGGFFSRLFREVGDGLCEPGALPERGIYRVLVCRPNHRLGNAVLVSPLIAEIERLYPGAEIDIVTGGEAASALFANHFSVRQVVCLPRRIARHLLAAVLQLVALRRTTYDLAIDASIGSQSGRLLLGAMKARYKVGYSAAHQAGMPRHHAQRSVFLLRQAHACPDDAPYPALDMRVSSLEWRRGRQTVRQILGEEAGGRSRTIVGVFANATGAKCYGEGWWTECLEGLQRLRPDLLFVDVLAEHGRSQLGGHYPSFYSRDIRKMGAVIASLDAFISADCGVMHLAAASGTPTFGLFAVTDPDKYAPYGNGSTAIATRDRTAEDTAAELAATIGRVVPMRRAWEETDYPASISR
jgi:heptosyltransferase-3